VQAQSLRGQRRAPLRTRRFVACGRSLRGERLASSTAQLLDGSEAKADRPRAQNARTACGSRACASVNIAICSAGPGPRVSGAESVPRWLQDEVDVTNGLRISVPTPSVPMQCSTTQCSV